MCTLLPIAYYKHNCYVLLSRITKSSTCIHIPIKSDYTIFIKLLACRKPRHESRL